MIPMTNTSPYEELLRITEEIILVLDRRGREDLSPLLKERGQVFGKIQSARHAPPPEAASWIRRIRECEDRCAAVAMERKGRIQKALQANRNRVRLGKRYRQVAQPQA
jgi:hypothetical protein